MNNVIVKPDKTGSCGWLVMIPHLPPNIAFSAHETKREALKEAREVCDDMGYDEIEIHD